MYMYLKSNLMAPKVHLVLKTALINRHVANPQTRELALELWKPGDLKIKI